MISMRPDRGPFNKSGIELSSCASVNAMLINTHAHVHLENSRVPFLPFFGLLPCFVHPY